MQVAALAPLCRLSAAVSAQTAAAAETYTCDPPPPPNTRRLQLIQCVVQYGFGTPKWCYFILYKKTPTYFVPELDVGLCQILDLSEEFALPYCTVLEWNHMRYK